MLRYTHCYATYLAIMLTQAFISFPNGKMANHLIPPAEWTDSKG